MRFRFALKLQNWFNPFRWQTMQNKAFSRVLNDKALEFSGRNLIDPKEVHLELADTTEK